MHGYGLDFKWDQKHWVFKGLAMIKMWCLADGKLTGLGAKGIFRNASFSYNMCKVWWWNIYAWNVIDIMF